MSAENEPCYGQSPSSSCVETSMYFLNRDPLFVTEKPYMFRFDIDTDEIPLTNTSFTKYSGMTVRDLRGQEHRFSIEKQGFAVLTLPREIRYEDYFDPNAVTEYFRSLEQLLVEYLGASKVEAFRHGIRKRHADFPVSTGKSYEYDQPTSMAHIDTTPEEAVREAIRQHGKAADSLPRSRVQWIKYVTKRVEAAARTFK
ncbi:hypothetical protein MMC10_009989 [Thelotrema lepadinum]|nr:hypothetical protein [Thelotrema lepadinum]